MSATSDEYLIRPVKHRERMTVLQLLFNKSSKTSLWFSAVGAVVLLTIGLLSIFYIAFTIIFLPAWDFFQVYGLQIKFVLNLSLVSLLFLILPLLYLGYFAVLVYKKANPSVSLVAVKKGKIVGFVSLIEIYGRNRIDRLFVKSEYRQQGIGTKLLQEAIKQTSGAIYINSISSQSHFYARLGFKKTEFKNPWRGWLNDGYINNNYLETLVLFSNSAMELNQSSSSPKYTFKKASDRDINNIYRLLKSSDYNTQDSLLPFGFNIALKLSLPYCLMLAILTMLLLGTLLLSLGLSNPIKIIIIAIAIIIFWFGFVFLQKITSAIIADKLSQFYLIQVQDLTIGYGRISRNREYSILHHISALSSYGTEPIDRLIKYISQLESQPVYVACTRQKAQLYYKHGFMPIKIKELPLKLQQGGKIGVKFGGVNLVLWS